MAELGALRAENERLGTHVASEEKLLDEEMAPPSRDIVNACACASPICG
jgi:hypothetical protein